MKLAPQSLLALYNKREDELLSNELEHATRLTTVEVAAILIEAIFKEHGEIFSKEEVDQETTKAYNQGYEDGETFFYGRTRASEQKILKLAQLIKEQS